MADLRHVSGEDGQSDETELDEVDAGVLDRLSAWGHEAALTRQTSAEPAGEGDDPAEGEDSAESEDSVAGDSGVDSDFTIDFTAFSAEAADAVEAVAAAETDTGDEAVWTVPGAETENTGDEDLVEAVDLVETDAVAETASVLEPRDAVTTEHARDDGNVAETAFVVGQEEVDPEASAVELVAESKTTSPEVVTFASGPSEQEKRRRRSLRDRRDTSSEPRSGKAPKDSRVKKLAGLKIGRSQRDVGTSVEGEREDVNLEGSAVEVEESEAVVPEVGTIASAPSEGEKRRRRSLRGGRGTQSEPRAQRAKKERSPKAPKAAKVPKAPKLPKGEKARKAPKLPKGEKAPKAPKLPKAAKTTKAAKDSKAKKLVGLKIGASQIAAAHVVNNGAPELVDVFREPLEPGLVVSGEIRDPDALGHALKRFFELHKLPKRGVRLGLANNRIGVRVFDIEGVSDPQQLENAIRFRAEEVLPIPLDEAVLDYVVLDDGGETGAKRILLVVAYRDVVDRYLQACRVAGLQVVGIDLEAFALLRSLEAPMDRDPSAGALVGVAIGHDRTTIAVSTGRLCEFTRVLDWGGWSLNVAIARELDRAPSEVEAVKRQLSFAEDSEVDGLTADQVAKVRNAAQRTLEAFTRELVASLHFYQAQPGALGIGEVVLTGGTAHMEGLPDAVGQLVGVPIRVGDPFRRLKVGSRVVHDAQYGSVAVAIGLGIED